MQTKTQEILLDTNFIIITTKQKIQLVEQLKQLFGVYTLFVPEQVLEELNKISNDRNLKVADRTSAKLSLQILKLLKPKIIDLKKVDADAGIIQYSKDKSELIIATLDRILKQKIKQKNSKIKFLTIKQKTRIAIQ